MPTAEDGFRTYNPVIGCPIGCRYCYARRMNERFQIVPDFAQIHWRGPYGVRKNGRPELFCTRDMQSVNWFLTSMSDFGLWEGEWAANVLEQCHMANSMKLSLGKPLDTFTFLTKRPEGLQLQYCEGKWLKNVYVGVTVTQNDDLHRIQTLLEKTRGLQVSKMVTFEPVLERLHVKEDDLAGVDWVIVGPETGHSPGKVQMERWWLDDLLEVCRKLRIPVKMKVVLKEMFGDHWMGQMPNLVPLPE